MLNGDFGTSPSCWQHSGRSGSHLSLIGSFDAYFIRSARDQMHISLATRRHTVVGIIEGASQDHCQTAAMHAQCPPWVNRYRSLRTENRSMSAVARKRRKVRALACVAKGHGGGRREPLQRSVMMVARFCRSITPTAPAFERGRFRR